MPKIALITGATSGIGQATAEAFAAQNINLILCGRRTDRLETLKEALSKKVNVHTLAFDVCDKQAVAQQINSLPQEWQAIDILINNAGNAHGLSPIQDGSMDDWDTMIDLNIKGLLYVSKAILPLMLRQGSGHIIHIGSLAGQEAYPNGNVYCATKSAVAMLNQGMRMDLFKHGIKVGAVNPGLVETEFSLVRFKGDADRSQKVYEGYEPLQAQDVAEVITFVVTRPKHVNLADVLVLPMAQAAATMVDKK
jgi:3-hydroxy acid dehydrogenase / malonic semialdehyde reductase